MSKKKELDMEIVRTEIKIRDLETTIAFCQKTNNQRGLDRAQKELFETQAMYFRLQAKWRSMNAKTVWERRREEADRYFIEEELAGHHMTPEDKRAFAEKQAKEKLAMTAN